MVFSSLKWEKINDNWSFKSYPIVPWKCTPWVYTCQEGLAHRSWQPLSRKGIINGSFAEISNKKTVTSTECLQYCGGSRKRRQFFPVILHIYCVSWARKSLKWCILDFTTMDSRDSKAKSLDHYSQRPNINWSRVWLTLESLVYPEECRK